MPDISGKIVLREVKRIRPTLPVVIISGFATVQSAIQCMRLGAATVLEKPFTPEELTAAVSHALKTAEKEIDEEQGLVHDKEVLNILNRAVRNSGFTKDLVEKGAVTLEGYTLTGSEKLALLTGDVEWFEQYIGVLDPEHKKILNKIGSAPEFGR
jgi:DNA-binding response OmpR family regulator